MFSEDDADLSGIAGEKGELLVDAVLQKTFIDVSEEGVEAAAATFAGKLVFCLCVRYIMHNFSVIRIPMSRCETPPVPFIADHPFIFYIKVDDVVIFAGRVTEPRY
jgi:serpin B